MNIILNGPCHNYASEWLKPIYRQIKDQMMRGSYLQVDETPIRYLDPGNGKTGLGYLWVAHRPGEDVLFEWYTTREAQCLDKLIPLDFIGTLQCDGYSAYDPSPGIGRARVGQSCSQDAGPMPGVAFTKPSIMQPKKPAGS